MYQQYYGLARLPFQLSPDSEFFYSSTVHRRAVAHLVHGLQQREGFVVITGEIGAGKTTLVELLWSFLDETAFEIVRVASASVSADDLLRLIAHGLGAEAAPDKVTTLRQIEQRLRALRAAGRRPLLVVDEAQALSIEGLKELRMVSNAAEGGRALVQIILVGQPELRQTLQLPELYQVQQCVLASHHLGPLAADEVRGYIERRMKAAGGGDRPQWDDAAVERIYHHTGGLPRRINRLGARLLLHGSLEETDTITAAMVDMTADELTADIGADQAPLTQPVQAALADRVAMLEMKLDRVMEQLRLHESPAA